jgi:hypothetical protein
MPEKWMSIVQAAAQLNCHTRTIERRIASGKIQSRKGDDGITQVLLDVPDMPEPGPTAIETVKELAQDQVSIATGSATALVKFAQADAERARMEMQLVREEATRVQKGARFAWSSVAAMAACVLLAVGWTTHRITKADAQIQNLNTSTAELRRQADQLLVERNKARDELSAARFAEGEAQGRLFQAQTMSAKSPTTQPTSVISRMANVILGE